METVGLEVRVPGECRGANALRGQEAQDHQP